MLNTSRGGHQFDTRRPDRLFDLSRGHLGFGGRLRGKPRRRMVLRIKLPGAKLKDLDLSVDKQKIVVQDPTYRLATYLPYPSDDSQGKAQWLAEKETLSVTLPILRSGW